MNKAFQKWRTRVKHENEEQVDGKKEGDRRLEKERTYGIKNWEMGASGPLRLTSSQEEFIPNHTIPYTPARADKESD
eukprot:3364708-Pleurochrysis_carterae.AAC.1